jgi:hypothetical protein
MQLPCRCAGGAHSNSPRWPRRDVSVSSAARPMGCVGSSAAARGGIAQRLRVPRREPAALLRRRRAASGARSVITADICIPAVDIAPMHEEARCFAAAVGCTGSIHGGTRPKPRPVPELVEMDAAEAPDAGAAPLPSEPPAAAAGAAMDASAAPDAACAAPPAAPAGVLAAAPAGADCAGGPGADASEDATTPPAPLATVAALPPAPQPAAAPAAPPPPEPPKPQARHPPQKPRGLQMRSRAALWAQKRFSDLTLGESLCASLLPLETRV